jgi:hypothetical protein
MNGILRLKNESPFYNKQIRSGAIGVSGCRVVLTEQPGRHGVVLLGALEDGLGQRQGVAHHGAVQPVLRHDGGPAPALLRLTPFRSPILEPHLATNTYITFNTPPLNYLSVP